MENRFELENLDGEKTGHVLYITSDGGISITGQDIKSNLHVFVNTDEIKDLICTLIQKHYGDSLKTTQDLLNTINHKQVTKKQKHGHKR